MPRTKTVAALKKPSAARKTIEPTRLARRYWPKLAGCGKSFTTTSPAAAVSSPRIGVYTLHLSGDVAQIESSGESSDRKAAERTKHDSGEDERQERH